MSVDLLARELRAWQKVLLVGPPGCGKTARVRAGAEKAGFRVAAWRLAQCDRVDVAGALVPDFAAGVTRQLPLEPLANIIRSEGPVLWFLDDLGQAPIDVQAAVLRYFDSGELPGHVLIWAATNRVSDRAGVVGLIEPLRSRFDAAYVIPTPAVAQEQRRGASPHIQALGTWEDEVRGWLAWAERTYPDCPEIIGWIRLSLTQDGSELPQGQQPILYGWEPQSDPAVRLPDYRTWEAALRRWRAGLRDLDSLRACVGGQQAQALMAWLEGVRAPSVDEIYANPEQVPLPDGAYTLTLARLEAALREGRKVEPAVIYITRWPEQWAYAAARALYRVRPECGRSKPWRDWYAAHKELFTL